MSEIIKTNNYILFQNNHRQTEKTQLTESGLVKTSCMKAATVSGPVA